MKNLEKVLKDKKLEDLKKDKVVVEPNLLEPTEDEIEQIITKLVDGAHYKEIRKSVRRVVMDGETQISAKGFSYGQIKEIELGMKAKYKELYDIANPVVNEEG